MKKAGIIAGFLSLGLTGLPAAVLATSPVQSNWRKVEITTEEGIEVRAELMVDGGLKAICVRWQGKSVSLVPSPDFRKVMPRIDQLRVVDAIVFGDGGKKEATRFDLEVPILESQKTVNELDTRLKTSILRITFRGEAVSTSFWTPEGLSIIEDRSSVEVSRSCLL